MATAALLSYASPRNLILLIAFVASVYLDYSILRAASMTVAQQKRDKPLIYSAPEYSYIGKDYPGRVEISVEDVRIMTEESVHFALTEPESATEWLWTAPVGDNHLRLGPEKRTFALAMVHELHCLRLIREIMEVGAENPDEHIHHCLNYLRQWTLCDADATLEPGNWKEKDYETERTGTQYQCRDWDPVYALVRQNWLDWKVYKQAHEEADISLNISTSLGDSMGV